MKTVKNIWLTRAVGHNPLVRSSDRIEAVVTAVVAVVLLLVIPLACAVGTAVHETQTRYLAEMMATRQQISAEVTEDSVGTEDWYAAGARTSVRWTHNGQIHTDAVFSQHWRTAGETLTIWIDDSGQRIPALPDAGVPPFIAVIAALTVWFGAAIIAAIVLGTQRAWLNHRRLMLWEQEYRLLVGGR